MLCYKQGLEDAWNAVNVLGAPDSACISNAEREYCRANGHVLAAIEILQLENGREELLTRLESMLIELRKPYNGLISPEEAARR